MSRDLKLTYGILLAMLLLAEALALTGVVRAPHQEWLDELSIPNLGTYALFVLVLYAFSRPAVAEAAKVAVLGTVLALLALSVHAGSAAASSYWNWIFAASAGYGAAALAAFLFRLIRGAGDIRLTRDLLAASGIAPLADPTVSALLNLTLAVHPETFDLGAYRFDMTLGFQPSAILALTAEHLPAGIAVLTGAYLFQPYGISMLYALASTASRRQPFSVVAFQAVSALFCALLLFHLYPVAGPKYAFGVAFPSMLPDASGIDAVRSTLTQGARNGVPSLHLAWALSLWLAARCLGTAWVRALFAAWLGLTVLATLALGEHYFIDLVVAVPLTVGVIALSALGSPWQPKRWRAVCAGLGMTLAWVLVLRFGAGPLMAIPVLAWTAMVATVVASAAVYLPLERSWLAAPASGQIEPVAPATHDRIKPELRYAVLMFVLSGFAALVYQVLFSKTLALTFGSQATAAYTVLAVYMGGMALGAWLGGWYVSRRSDPLRLYALCELGIGAYCLATPLVFAAIQAIYVSLAAGVVPDAGALTVFRVLLGAVALMVPTVLMGATLPILADFMVRQSAALGGSVALLYAANTIGAALGALLAGYVIIPVLGVWKTTLTAAALNFVVALLAFRLWARARGAAGVTTTGRLIATPRLDEIDARRLGRIALVLLAAGGVVTLALEVVYIHLLAIVAGNSVYAFSLMLFTFLIGLGAGAEFARRLLKLGLPALPILAGLEFVLAAIVLGGVYGWEGLPAYFASFEHYPHAREFGAREVVRGLVCFVVMFPPAVIIGAIYPLAMECVGRAFRDAPIAAIGRAAALNTIGNILGVLAAGFWLLPAIGALRTLQLLAGICIALGVFALAYSALRRRPVAWAPALLVLAMLVVQPSSFDYTQLSSGANVYFANQGYGRTIDHAESVDGGLTTVSAVDIPGKQALRVLLTNGKFQGTNDLTGEGVAQAGIALSPLLHLDARERAVVIGYGTGMSARVLHDAGFRQLEIVDLSADIVRLANAHFDDVNERVTQKSGVRTYITDGRNFLLLQDRRYDLVSMEITSIWFAGAASLYNREFYQLVKRRLAPYGVLQQWVQLHHIHPRDILYILGSVRTEFRHVWLYLIGGQGVIVAADGPNAAPQAAYLERLERTDGLKPLFNRVGGLVRQLPEMRLLDPGGTDALLASANVPSGHWVSTDDNLHLEYATPKGNVLDGDRSFLQNVEWIRKMATESGTFRSR